MHKNIKRKIGIILSLSILISVPSFAEENSIDSGLSKLNSIINLTKRTYVKELSNDEIFDATYRGLFKSLKLESAYYSQEEFSEFVDQLNSLSINLGITIDNQDNGNVITSVSKGSSAYEKGVLPGDIVTSINGEEINGKEVLEVHRLLSGHEWENITIKVRRVGVDSEIEYDLVCKKIQANQISYEVIDNIGYIKIFQFTETNISFFDEAFNKLVKEEKVEGIIIDVRDNFGGELDSTAYIMDYFIPIEEKLLTLKYRVKEDEELLSTKEKVDLPLVILANERSVGSSEIFTGSIKEFPNVAVVGKQTFGDGRLQWIVPLQDGSGVKLTIGMIFTSNMKQIDSIGIHPTYLVENKNSEIERVLNVFSPMNSIRHSVIGMKDKDTLGAQERLNYLGYTTEESGYFNRDTELELAKFQSENGILNSGILNWETKSKLDEAVRVKASQKVDDLQKEKAVQVISELIKK